MDELLTTALFVLFIAFGISRYFVKIYRIQKFINPEQAEVQKGFVMGVYELIAKNYIWILSFLLIALLTALAGIYAFLGVLLLAAIVGIYYIQKS
jgi:uncharacterized membrane protein